MLLRHLIETKPTTTRLNCSAANPFLNLPPYIFRFLDDFSLKNQIGSLFKRDILENIDAVRFHELVCRLIGENVSMWCKAKPRNTILFDDRLWCRFASRNGR